MGYWKRGVKKPNQYQRARENKKAPDVKKLIWDTTTEPKLDKDESYKRFLASQNKLAELKERVEDECTDNNWNELVKLWKKLDEEDEKDLKS